MELSVIQNLNRPTHFIISNYLQKSKTMVLYEKIFQSVGVNHQYLPLELPTTTNYELSSDELRHFQRVLEAIRHNNQIISLVISNPYKQIILNYLDEVDGKALQIGSVNLVVNRNNRLHGYNIDGDAFWMGVMNRLNHRYDVLFFGAGGVASAVSYTFALHQAKSIGIYDPKVDKTLSLANRLQHHFNTLKIKCYRRFRDIGFEEYNVFYNGSGLGKFESDPLSTTKSPITDSVKLPAGGLGIDANYTPWETLFLHQCKRQHLETINGFPHMVSYTSIHLSKVLGRDLSYAYVYHQAKELVETDVGVTNTKPPLYSSQRFRSKISQ